MRVGASPSAPVVFVFVCAIWFSVASKVELVAPSARRDGPEPSDAVKTP